MKKLKLTSGLFSISLVSMSYVFAFSRGNLSLLMISQGVVLLIPFIGIFILDASKINRSNITLWGTIAMLLLINIYINKESYFTMSISYDMAVSQMLGFVGLLFSLQWAATNLVPEVILRNIAILLLPIVILAIAISFADIAGGARSSPLGVHPNWWGEIGFATVVSALTIRNWKIKTLIIGSAFILFYLVQSRGALVATGVALCVYTCISAKWIRLYHSWSFYGALMVMTIGLTLLWYKGAFYRIWVFIQDDIMLLDDRYRGVGTGLVGRLEGWLYAINVFADNPIFGSGIGTLREVHNGFLKIAGEGGLLLLLAIVSAIISSIYIAFRKHNYVVISVICGYIVLTMSYPRMLNMNIASAIFFLSLFSWPRRVVVDQDLKSRGSGAP